MYKVIIFGLIMLILYARQIAAQTPTPLPCGVTNTPTQSLTPTVTQILNYENIYISEFMPDPPTGEVEWVELYNDNDFDVVLSGWKIDDIADGGGAPRNINAAINSKNYAIVDFSSSLLNNDTDFVRLLDTANTLKDSFEYTASIKGKTIGRSPAENNVFCFQEPSKNLPNFGCINLTTPSPTTEPIITITPTPQPTILAVKNIKPTNAKSSFLPIKDVYAATIDVEDPKTHNFINESDKNISLNYFTPLVSFVFSLFSAGTILIKMRVDFA